VHALAEIHVSSDIILYNVECTHGKKSNFYHLKSTTGKIEVLKFNFI